jgi:hypothetical protein
MERRGAQRVGRTTRVALRKARHYGRLAALHSLVFEGDEMRRGRQAAPGPRQRAGAICHAFFTLPWRGRVDCQSEAKAVGVG